MAETLDDTQLIEELVSGTAEEEIELHLKKKKKKKVRVVDTHEEQSNNKSPWQDSERDYTYTELLGRAFQQMRENNPDLTTSKRHTLPPPKLTAGAKKTTWSNFLATCEALHRTSDHLMAYIAAELVTEGSVDASGRLIVKGRFNTKHIESLLKKYILAYVTCQTCKSPETCMIRDPVSRLHFLDCEHCKSRRSIAPIKSGFQATSRADRKAAKWAAS